MGLGLGSGLGLGPGYGWRRIEVRISRVGGAELRLEIANLREVRRAVLHQRRRALPRRRTALEAISR